MDIASSAVDREYTYRIPEGIDLSPGFRVSVPFGSRTIEGYVIGLTETSDLPADRVKDVLGTLEDYPALLPQCLALAKDIQQRFGCPLSTAIRLMLPAQMRGSRVKVKTEPVAQLCLSSEQAQAYLDALPKRQLRKRTLITILMDGEAHTLKDLRAMVRDPRPALEELSADNAVRIFDRETLRAPLFHPLAPSAVPTLTEEQRDAVDELCSGLERAQAGHAGRNTEFLLYGVTGSGKTEVYMRLAEQALSQALGVILLVPEIALTSQMVDWFQTRFGSAAAVLHSRLSAGERFDEWRRIRKGEARLVIGARSAVFAPVDRLGAIIIDEEHEATYFSETFPQYDARQIAHLRCAREGALLLLASATPSIASFAMARRGDYALLTMSRRANGRPLPDITLVDMRRELSLGNRSIFSLTLQKALKETLSSGQQAILFINRRGYSSSVSCLACGNTVKCRQCDVSMAYHRFDQRLHCHYCGASAPFPKVCPVCGSNAIKTIGVGTERVEEEVKRLFPNVRTLRMDMDTTRAHNAHSEIVNAFRSREAQVLIGTQMIAKGLDFPQVTLVGAVLSDLSLNMPDYRAAERTFQLLVQVAGRAGRAQMPGQVVIQTYQPEHYAIAASVSQDYRAYFEGEFARRRADLYPPFTLIARYLIESPSGTVSLDTALALKEKVVQYLNGSSLKKRLLLIRADESPIAFIEGRYRAQVLMKLLNHPDSDQILSHLQAWTGATDQGARITLEINPASLA